MERVCLPFVDRMLVKYRATKFGRHSGKDFNIKKKIHNGKRGSITIINKKLCCCKVQLIILNLNFQTSKRNKLTDYLPKIITEIHLNIAY